MATSKKYLISVLSNTYFGLDYTTNNLEPQIEVVLLTQESKYKANSKNELVKGVEVGEFRIFTSIDGLNQMIGELQLLASKMQNFQQLSVGINQLIEHSKTQNKNEQ